MVNEQQIKELAYTIWVEEGHQHPNWYHQLTRYNQQSINIEDVLIVRKITGNALWKW